MMKCDGCLIGVLLTLQCRHERMRHRSGKVHILACDRMYEPQGLRMQGQPVDGAA